MIFFHLLRLLSAFTFTAGAQELMFPGEPLMHTTVSGEHQRVSAVDEQRAHLVVPLHHSAVSHSSLFLRANRMAPGEVLSFAGGSIEIPEEFGSAELGYVFGRTMASGSKAGATLTYGVAGPHVFEETSPPILGANGFYQIPRDEESSWYIFLSYSNHRAFLNNIPLPGFAFARNWGNSRMMLGLPFLFYMWRPDPFYLTMTGSPFGASMESGYRVWGPLQVWAAAGWAPRSFLNLVEGSDDRLIYQRKEVTAGLKFSVSRQTNFSVAYVYGFDRQFYLGESFSDPSSVRINLADSAGVQVKAKLGF